ncbi:MAG: hypothetical protein HQL84_11770 [Magnetococcales bacterium]|nr:hypothetical protein [Magnetococcales bacterium]MBF0174429.1 hypothetical protein [Magnetococcales bacterium]MBF0346933.1 hypothetical protein [Magnetococcales bacterium]MBF0631668.1 hypothetical protein [Magnetococcales bacterium]
MMGGWVDPGGVVAAPLDELLSVQQETRPFHGEVEAGWDGMNEYLDVFGVREEDPRGKNIGDYSGQHLRGGLALDRRLWSDGSFWQRTVKTPFDRGDNKTYQAGIQYQVTDNRDKIPAISLRISGWGNSSSEAIKGSPTPVYGTGFMTDSIAIKKPSDRQFQGDIIGSWALTPSTSISLFASQGISEVKVGDIFASFGDCNYKIERVLQPDEVNGGWDSAVNGKAVDVNNPNCGITSFTIPMSAYNAPELPPGMYVSYDASYYQLGGMTQWNNHDWRFRLGYRYQKWDRGELDDSIALLQHVDKTVYDTNHHITGEISYKLHPNVAAYARSQYMTNQFLGEVPYSYNLFSSHKFEKPYGFLSFGLSAGF